MLFQAAELYDITQDPSWREASWEAMEACIPALLKEQAVSDTFYRDTVETACLFQVSNQFVLLVLQDAVASLEQGILTERQCTQLIEQHEAAQDWLREQVKGLGAPPLDRQTLHSTINTLKVR